MFNYAPCPDCGDPTYGTTRPDGSHCPLCRVCYCRTVLDTIVEDGRDPNEEDD